ncbi:MULTISPECIES: DUF6026 family protein [unclassified Pseudomonas]|uniref:DUF6026 family protein n=1 Tax=unclassified Pseudomonas TaxID=196821 RepID=UPI002AC93387|nr:MULTISPECIES: DUF6026 family protein [unclassified Pseudomonas]MEB0040646.1 DUF6026 family protein [Pseudomonas sp. MH10]MEB0076161.1 DUF6026 family protein [Pseudomonas sp. MH10out]MEB0090656.1 DUF6026 family protein [Pseudomonas sp. CCI4.2]MEB0103801.1 DUF6026 family protein [Pseudomonas sp. CCI3.2]MEB0119644.1 DUF6026 family protein [Pseudomonas sp. CCI1.2]
MGTLLSALPPQTLYVSIRRDELRQLKDERDQLLRKVARLTERLQTLAQTDSNPASRLTN